MAKDWTKDPISGRSNSSGEFLRLVAEVNRIIRSSAHSLIAGDSESVARLIMAQLAHRQGMMPKKESSHGRE